MGIFAWLMLVVTSVAAAPMGMQAQDAQSIQAATSISGVHCHNDGLAGDSAADVHQRADCCGGQAVPGCHCPAMCVSAVPATLTMLATVRLSISYRMPPQIVAPAPNSAPPLRPPLV